MIPVTPQPNRSTGPHVYVPGAPDRAARRLVMAHALADLTFAFLLLALAAAGQPQPQRSLESLERQIAEAYRRDYITLDDEITALFAVQPRGR